MRENYIVARVGRYTRSNCRGIQKHNDRESDNHSNTDIIPERSELNVELVEDRPDELYTESFDRMIAENKISTSGLRGDAFIMDEILHDVNSEYWLSYKKHGYESPEAFARSYFDACFEFDKKKYGEDKILSAKIHMDEINQELTAKYGFPVWHYHMHVVAIPTVTKEKKWSKRCKDPELVGTVKERITQVSHYKFWEWNKGEEKSYAKFQSELYDHLHGQFPDLQRGEPGSNAKHLKPDKYKAVQDELRGLQQQLERKQAQVTSLETALDELNAVNNENLKIIKENEQILIMQQDALQLIRSFDQYLQEAQEVNDNLDTLEETTRQLPGAAKLFKESAAQAWIRDMLALIRAARRMVDVGIRRLKIFEYSYDVPEFLSEPAQKRASALDKQIEAASQRAGTFRNETLERSR